MIQDKRNNVPLNIDWDALDKSWADQYEEDYGCHFSNMFLYGIKSHILAPSHIEESIAGLV